MQGYFFVSPQSKRTKVAVLKEFKTKILEIFRKYGIRMPYDHMTITVG